jgi:hypothetical protein
MLVQPRRQPVSLLLRPPEIPGSPEQLLPSGERAINRAAALDNFPDNGLKVYVPAWSAMGKGDKVELLFNGLVVDQHTLTENTEVGERVTVWVAPKHWLTGSHTLAYRVTRFNQSPETYAPALELYAKLEIPAGQDTDEAEGRHSNLYMFIDPAIVEGIVDKEIAEDGVAVIVRAESGTGAPYPDAAVGDVIVVSWGGVYVESESLTAEQISDPVNHPIVIRIVKAIILLAGDTDSTGLAVTFRVRDVVENYSEDWCKATRLVVMTGTDLLEAPVVQEAVNNVLDLDALLEKNLTVEVWAKGPAFKLEDRIVLKMRGTTVDNEAVEITAPPQTINNLPHTYKFILFNVDVRKLAKTQVTFTCHVDRPGTPEPLRSKGQFVTFIGEPKRLAAPSAEDEQNGAIDPDLLSPRVRIPFDLIMLLGMAIELIWSGTRPDKSSYTPDLEWYFPTQAEIDAKEDFYVPVDGKHLKTLEGGTLVLWYYLLREGPNGEIIRSESLHAAQLNVGEPQFELVKPIVLGEQEGALEPNDWPNGTGKLTAPRPTVNPTQSGDIVTYKWVGEVTGPKEDSVTLNGLSKDKDVHFTLSAAFVAEHIEPNRGKKVTVSYRIWRAATGETSYSNGLEFVVGKALELELTAPTIDEAPNDTLKPIDAKDTLTVVVKQYVDMDPAHKIVVKWEGTAGSGSLETEPVEVGKVGELRIPIDNKVVAFNLGKQVTVRYGIIVGGEESQWSEAYLLDVQNISDEDSDWPTPTVPQAPDNTVLDLSKFESDATVICTAWPLIRGGQRIWLRCYGTRASDNSSYPIVLANSIEISDAEAGVGLNKVLARSELSLLKDNTALRVELKVALDGNVSEAAAVKFRELRLTVKTTPGLIIDPTPMTLYGRNISLAGSGINYTYSGNDPANTTEKRTPVKGSPPYTYASSNPLIAFVDSTGLVRSEGNGTATITVSDQNTSGTYEVKVTNTTRTIHNTTHMTYPQYIEWAARSHAYPLSDAEDPGFLTLTGAKYLIGLTLPADPTLWYALNRPAFPHNPEACYVLGRRRGQSLQIGGYFLNYDPALKFAGIAFTDASAD